MASLSPLFQSDFGGKLCACVCSHSYMCMYEQLEEAQRWSGQCVACGVRQAGIKRLSWLLGRRLLVDDVSQSLGISVCCGLVYIVTAMYSDGPQHRKLFALENHKQVDRQISCDAILVRTTRNHSVSQRIRSGVVLLLSPPVEIHIRISWSNRYRIYGVLCGFCCQYIIYINQWLIHMYLLLLRDVLLSPQNDDQLFSREYYKVLNLIGTNWRFLCFLLLYKTLAKLFVSFKM